MKACPSCKVKYEDSSKFCRKCGSPLQAERLLSPDVIAKRHIFEDRISQAPQDPTILAEYGAYLASLELYNEALLQFFKALELDASNESIRRSIAQIYRSQGDLHKAAVQLLILIENRPADLSQREELVAVYLAGKKLSEAEAALKQMSALEPMNLDLLHRRLDILKKLGKAQEVIEIARRIVEIEPSDLSTWLFLVDRLLTEGQDQEALRAFESILSLDPDSPRAKLYVGIARHDDGLGSGGHKISEAAKLLTDALAHEHALSPEEGNIARLFLCSARLQAHEFAPDTIRQLKQVTPDDLSHSQVELLARCYLLLGEIRQSLQELDEAKESFEASLNYADSEEARTHLAALFASSGDRLLSQKKYGAARKEYEKSLRYSPDYPDLSVKIQTAAALQKRRAVVTSLIVIALLALGSAAGAFVYYGQGAFEIRTNPAGRISFYRGEALLDRTEGGVLLTSIVPFGSSYELRVEKEGYRSFSMPLRPFWRERKQIQIELAPVYGTLKVDSEPPGARVLVRNRYQEKSCQAPCGIKDLFALVNKIEASLPGYLPFTTEKEIPAGAALDLGTVAFKGSLKVDSDPSEAEIFLNNEPQGTTPAHLENLPAKLARLEIRKSEAGAYIEEIAIEPGKGADLGTVKLSNKGQCRLNTRPEGAKVFLDGKEAGSTPLSLAELEAGSHSLRIDMEGCAPMQQTLKIKPGEVTNLGTVSFLSSLKVASDPDGAEVYIGGAHRGITPAVVEGLLARSTLVELSIPGIPVATATASLQPDKLTDLGTVRFGFESFSNVRMGLSNRESYSGHFCDLYYPLKPGISWKYQIRVQTTTGRNEIDQLIVSNLDAEGLSGKTVVPQRLDRGGKITHRYMTQDREGIGELARRLEGDTELRPNVPPPYVLKDPVRVGTAWNEDIHVFLLPKAAPIPLNLTIASVSEEVRVPAGSFKKCIRVKGSTSARIDYVDGHTRDVELELSYWLAPNVGRVKLLKEEKVTDLTGSGKATRGSVTFQLEEFRSEKSP